jgi:hypothetical protein
MERALRAGKTLADDFCIFIDKYGHIEILNIYTVTARENLREAFDFPLLSMNRPSSQRGTAK